MCQHQRNHCSGRLLPGNTAYHVRGYLGIQTARVTLEWDDGAWALAGVCCPTVHTLENFHKFLGCLFALFHFLGVSFHIADFFLGGLG